MVIGGNDDDMGMTDVGVSEAPEWCQLPAWSCHTVERQVPCWAAAAALPKECALHL